MGKYMRLTSTGIPRKGACRHRARPAMSRRPLYVTSIVGAFSLPPFPSHPSPGVIPAFLLK